MPAIPEVDIAVTLIDTGYALPITAEGDGSFTFGQFGLAEVSPGATSLGEGSVGNVAQFPSYNSGFAGEISTTNFNLGVTRGDESLTPAAGYTEEAALHSQAGEILILDITNIFTTGTINAKTQAWPGPIDYTNAGMIPLVIANQSIGGSFIAVKSVVLDDSTKAFCVSADMDGTGILPSDSYNLIVKPDLSTSGWISDGFNSSFGLRACTYLSAGVNYQADYSALPTVTTYTLTYNFATGSAGTVLGSGDVSTDAANALSAPRFTTPFLTPHGLFGIDSESGNNTGCWYCALDCTAFGRVNFTMPDLSLGPSSSPTVWNVFNSHLSYATYPNVDDLGNWWWIRLPLCDGAGNIIMEPLTSEVYRSGGAPPAATGGMMGTHVAFSSAGQFGGTK